MKRLIVLTAAWLIFGSAGSLFAQGVQTGTIRGMVKDQQDLAVPGVTVTVTSPALQGPRSTVTDREGLFAVRALPPGDYQVKFELSGFATITRNTVVPLGLVVETNITMRAANVAETVQVTAEAPAPIVDAGRRRQLQARGDRAAGHAPHDSGHRPACRRRSTRTRRTPASWSSTARSPSTTCSWSTASTSTTTCLRQPQNLFIEDAIEETQVLTSGISAEYGRFTGGVDQRHHQERRQCLLGQRPSQLPESVTGRPRRRSKNASTRPSSRARAPSTASRQAVAERTKAPSAVRSCGTACGSSRRAATDRVEQLDHAADRPASCCRPPTRTSAVRSRSPARSPANHTIQGGYLNDPRTSTNNSGIQSLVIDPHSEVDRRESELVLPTATTGAC